MPGWINGIGTTYRNKKNRSRIESVCEHCGRVGWLESYDTREWFIFIFVPIVPLKRYRVLDQCGSCTRHRQIPEADFAALKAAELEPFQAALASDPANIETRLRAADALARLRLFVEAEALLLEGVQRTASPGTLHFRMGELRAAQADPKGAAVAFRNAVNTGGVPLARRELGRALYRGGNAEEAARELEAARGSSPRDPDTAWLLAQAYDKLGRHTEASPLVEELRSSAPDLAESEEFLAVSRRTKQALGLAVSPEEKKAGRRWLPSLAELRTRPMRWRQVVTVIGLGALVTGGGFAAYGTYRQRHIPLYIDNALGREVTVRFGGETFEVAAGERLERTIAPGRYEVVTMDGEGELERFEASITKDRLTTAVVSDRFFVYNVQTRRLYRLQLLTYATEESEAGYQEDIVGLERFFQQRDIDFAFREPPERITVDERDRKTLRRGFQAADDLDLNDYAIARLGAGDAKRAEQAWRLLVAGEPCHAEAWRSLVLVVSSQGRGPGETADLAREWGQACPAEQLEAERAWQDAEQAAGRGDAVRATYRARLAEHPEVAANHYLLGRLVEEPEAAIALYRRALQLDPTLSRASHALGRVLLGLERDAEAKAALEPLLANPSADPAILELYAQAAAGAGELLAARARLGSVTATNTNRLALLQARWILVLAGDLWDEAEGMVEELSALAGGAPEVTWSWRAQLAQVRGDAEALSRLLNAAGKNPALKQARLGAELETALSARDWTKAAKLAQQLAKDYDDGLGSALFRLYQAASLTAAGERARANEVLAPVRMELSERSGTVGASTLLALADVLADRSGPSAAARPIPELAAHHAFLLALDALGRGQGSRARELAELARRRALDFRFPYCAARALTGSP